MGKKQHQKDKLYVTATEWAVEGGGKKSQGQDPETRAYKRLPFDHCALSLQPFTNPYCDGQGHVFDLVHIVPYLKKFKSNPVTGQKLEASELTKLIFHRDAEGRPQCPVLFKVFNDSTHIAAVRTTGHVYSYQALAELNLKANNWKDLLNDEPFQRSDIIVLQDPSTCAEKFNLSQFHHVQKRLKVDDDELERAKTDPRARLKRVNAETKDALAELDRTYKAPEVKVTEEEKPDKFNAAHFSTGKVAASFTSTAQNRTLVHEAAILEEDVVRYARVKKKAYVRLVTNVGPINVELHSDYVPKTCENFLKLCQKNYYNGTKFHRSIRHFMIQGGDPTGTGTGGESYWGEPFKDEFKPFLTHTGRGILSMANSGPSTNKSQFFITFRSCKHLDGKHTVFGKVVGGMETLSALERVETDNKDRPIEDLILERTSVFVDPFKEVDDQLAKERQEELEKTKVQEASLIEKKKSGTEQKVYGKGVGKFLNPSLKREARKAESEESSSGVETKKKKKTSDASYGFSNFSAW